MPQITIKPHVVDVSHYNKIGWPSPNDTTLSGFLKAKQQGIWGVIHKATEGTGNRDATMTYRRQAANDAGLLWGTYHFIRPKNIKAQADWYLSVAKPTEADLVSLDWEDNRVSASAAREWLEYVANKLGRKPVIYSGNTAKELVRGKDPFFGAHRLWLAQYSSIPTTQRSWSKFWLWQYTGDGKGPMPHTIDGITIPGNKGIDINHYDGTVAQLKREWSI